MKRLECVLVLLALAAAPLAADQPVTVQTKAPPHTKSVLLYEKLDSALNKIVDTTDPLDLAERAGFKVIDGRIQIVITCAEGTANDVEEFLRTIGAVDVRVVRDFVRADVEPMLLLEINNHADVLFLTKPDYLLPEDRRPPIVERPKFLMVSEGVQAMNADAWHAAGFTGQGVRVGLIDMGFAGYQSLVGTELPPSSMLHYQRFSAYPSSDNHGTACAEIVHDVAPDAEIFLAEIADPIFEGADAINWLFSQGVDVVSASMGIFAGGPGDGTGIFADALNLYHQEGGLVFISAGNHRKRHWQGHWSDPNGTGWHDFDSQHEINYITEDGSNPAWIPILSTFNVFLSWNQWEAPTTDLDLCVYYDDGQGTFYELICSENPQNGQQGQLPKETLAVVALASGHYGFAIRRDSGTTAPDMEVFFGYKEPIFKVADGSILVPSDAEEATATAALDAGGSFPLEPYSSRGPANGPGGALSGGYIKPDIAGYANVSTASRGPRVPGSGEDFDGTSAACPHVAGAAAVVWSAHPGWSNNQVRTYLRNNAVDMGPAGKDNDYGFGRLYLGDPPSSCTYNISPTSASYGASGGSGSFQVSTQAGCTWNASSNNNWIHITGGASGTGNGTVSYSVDANGGSSSRTGTISAAGKTFTITQSGASSCNYTISPTSQSFGASGGNGSVSVSTTAGCTWTASSNNSWIHVTSGSSGTGSGTVNYSVDANSGSARTGTMTIADHTFTVTQSGGGGGDTYTYQVAGVAHAGGAGGSVWRSTLCVTNRSGSTANLTLVYRMASNSVTRTHVLQNGRIKEWADVAVSLFNQSANTSGAIEITSDAPVMVVARTYNEAPDGTFGQGMPGNDDSQTLASGQMGVLPQLKKTSAFRTNVGLMNHGSAACNVRIKLFSETGAQLGSVINTSVPAKQWKQINDVFNEAGVAQCQIGYATIEVLTAGGKIWAYGSVVDNGTGDPTTISLFIE